MGICLDNAWSDTSTGSAQVLPGADVALDSWPDNLKLVEKLQRGKTDVCSMDMVLAPENMGLFGMFSDFPYFIRLSGTVTITAFS